MIKNEKEYKTATDKIEQLLQKATKKGGFEKITANESAQLNELSLAVNKYEKTHYSIPIPKTIDGILELKMFEKKLKQKEMAKLLGITETKLSEIIHHKRKPSVSFLSAMHQRLKVDGNLLLEIVA